LEEKERGRNKCLNRKEARRKQRKKRGTREWRWVQLRWRKRRRWKRRKRWRRSVTWKKYTSTSVAQGAVVSTV